MGPLLPADGTRKSRLQRRARGIAIIVGAWCALTLLAPLVLAGAVVVDLVLWLARRKPWTAVRLAAFAWWFLLGEILGLLALVRIYAASAGRDTRRRRWGVYRLRMRWAGRILGGIQRLFGVAIEVEDGEKAAPGGAIVAIRHASIIDNLLPDNFIAAPHQIGLRFILKKELELLPLIDIGARWIPTNFIRRASGDVATELAQLEKLAVELGDDESVLIYPEGTRWTPPKLERAKEKLRERRPDLAELAEPLRDTLVPRTAGFVALLQRAPDADVVFCSHVGLDGFEYIRDIWRGGLVGATVRIRFWRHAAADVPKEPEAQERWLLERWVELDEWVGRAKAELPAAGRRR